MTVALVLASVGACGDGGSGSERASGRGQEPSSTEQDDDLPTGFSETGIRGAQFQVVGDEIWMFGGLTGVPTEWAANSTVFRYGVDGTHLGTFDLPLPDGRFIFFSGSYVDGDRLIVVGDTCVVSSSENGGCTSPVVPVAFAATPEEVVPLTLPSGWTDGQGDGPGDGMVYLRGGGTDGRALLTRVTGPGPVENLTHEFETVAVDLATGDSRTLAPPAGALTPDSVCQLGDRVFTLVPKLGDALRLESVQVFQQSLDGGEAQLFADVTTFASEAVVGGRIHCLADALVLQAEASPAELVVLDAETGEQIGDAVQVPAPVPSTWISPDARSLLVSTMGSATATDEGVVTDSGHEASFYEVSRDGGVTPIGSLDMRQGELTYAVAVDGRVVDAAHWSRDPQSSDPPRQIA